jgi:transposase
MILFPDHTRAYLVMGWTDMRKSINGLSMMVEGRFDLDPFSGHVFVFCNRRRSIVKILYWHRNGFCLWQKRLEKEKFRWPESYEEVMEIGSRRLGWLLDGLEITQVRGHELLHYSTVI